MACEGHSATHPPRRFRDSKDRQMRREFLEVATIEEAQANCPWAAEIVEVDGGFMAFESMDEYNTWANGADAAVEA